MRNLTIKQFQRLGLGSGRLLYHLQPGTRGSHSQNGVEALNFSDHKTVFQFKKTRELLRSLLILRVCKYPSLVDNALPLMRFGEKWLGQRIFSALARPTFYTQFVGGDTEQELTETSSKMKASGLRLMVCPAMEEDEGEGGSEEKYDYNMEYISNIGDMMVRAGAERPCLQFKITAFAPADLVTKISGLLSTGSLEMSSVVGVISSGLESGEEISLAELTPAENGQLNLAVRRIAQFGKKGVDNGLHLLVDAEYTYMNKGISAMALALMVALNKERPVVWNTYQCYLKAALTTVTSEMEVVEGFGRSFGAKIVRGAYMDKERKLARERGYEDPVNDSYEATGEMYNRVVDMLMTHIARVGQDKCNIVCATHNEAAARHAANKLVSLGLPVEDGPVVFGQIYGMADQISVPLAAAGFTVYKSVPYGPLTEVLPYLSRRASENKVVLAGARRERELLRRELQRRYSQRLPGLRSVLA